MTDKKPKIIVVECPNCEEDFGWDISGELNDAFEQGKLAERERIIRGIEGQNLHKVGTGYRVYRWLKSQLSKDEK